MGEPLRALRAPSLSAFAVIVIAAAAPIRGAAPPPIPAAFLRVGAGLENSWVDNLALSPDGTRLAAIVSARHNPHKKRSGGSSDLEVYDLKQPKRPPSRFELDRASIHRGFFKFSHDGKRLYWLVSKRGEEVPRTARWFSARLQVFDLAKGKVVRSIDLPDDAGCACLLPDDRTLALSGPSEAVILFDLKDEKVVARLKGEEKYPADFPKGHEKTNEGYREARQHATVRIAVSRDGKHLAVSSQAGHISVWDVAGRKRLWREMDGDPRALGNRHVAMSFSPDGETLVSILEGSQSMYFRYAKNGKDRFSFTKRAFCFAEYLPDGTMVIDRGLVYREFSLCVGRFGWIRWDPVEDRYYGEGWDWPDRETAPDIIDMQHTQWVVSANGKVIAHAGVRQGLVAYDLTKFWPRP